MADVKEIVGDLNRRAMIDLKALNFEYCHSLLSLAQSTLKKHKIQQADPLWGITFNNLGCYFKKQGKHSVSLHYYNRVLQTDIDPINLAGAYLNISTVKSHMDDTGSGIVYAQKAIQILDDKPSPTLVLAYKHLGDLHKSEENWVEAASYYQKSLEFAKDTLGSRELLQNIYSEFLDCLRKSRLRSSLKISNLPEIANRTFATPDVKKIAKTYRKKKLTKHKLTSFAGNPRKVLLKH